MKAVHVITTGGTIASRVDPVTGGAVPAVTARELVAMSPSLQHFADDIRVTDFGLLQSWNIGPDVMARVAESVIQAFADPDVHGCVVTHGTDTMEETAFALDLLVHDERPVVIAGAMRNASDPAFDGPRSLAAAVRVAASAEAQGLGTLLVMNEEIHAARFVTKTHTTALDPFASPDAGALGIIDDRGVWIRRRLSRQPKLANVAAHSDVHLVTMSAGASDLHLRALVSAGVAGVVLEGSGAGNVPNVWNASVRELVAAGTPVVLTSRCGRGRIVPVYGGPGGGRTLHDLGVIDGGWLSGRKARVALAIAIANGSGTDQIRDYFAELTR